MEVPSSPRDSHGTSIRRTSMRFTWAMEIPWDSTRDFHGTLMGFRSSHGTSVVRPYDFHFTPMDGVPIARPWCSCGVSAGRSWDFHGTSLGLQKSHEASVVLPSGVCAFFWTSSASWVRHGTPKALPSSHGIPILPTDFRVRLRKSDRSSIVGSVRLRS